MTLDEMITERKRLDAEIKRLKEQRVQCGKARLIKNRSSYSPHSDKWRLQVETTTEDGGKRWIPLCCGDDKIALLAVVPDIVKDLQDLCNEVLHGKA